MDSTKYIGMDVHKESISIAVMNAAGKIVMECVIETKASMILQFIDGLRGDLHVTFEEGTWAAWLYDLLKPHVTKLVVCDPRKNASMREGNKSDQIDARQLAELLRLNHLSPVYHGEHGVRSLKELVRSYLTISKDLGTGDDAGEGDLSQLGHSLYRQAGLCAAPSCASGSAKITEAGVRRRAEFYYQQLDALRALRQQVRRDLLAESKKHQAWKLLCQIPSIGPIRAARVDRRFCRPRIVSAPSGSCGRTADLASRRTAAPITGMSKGSCNESKKQVSIRGLNRNYNHDLKNLFKGAAIIAADQARSVSGVLRGFAGQGHAAGDGASDPGAQDCHDHFDRLEERSVLRRPISETTNSLSVSDRVRSISGDLLWRWPSGSRDTLVRERVSADKLGAACLGHPVSQPTLGPLG